jgi:biopolymer transport protein ExbD
MAAIIAPARRTQFAPAAEPNVIPFIDVLLVLVIIFMATAPKPTTDLRVDLPRPGPAAAARIEPTIVEIREIAGAAHAFVGGAEVSRRQLAREALARTLAANPVLTAETAYADATIYVRADLDVGYTDVLAAVEALQQGRFRKVAIMAERAD